MIADIFYPIFTLTITILACFIQKKIGSFTPMPLPGHHPGPPGWLIARPRPQAAIIFGFAKN